MTVFTVTVYMQNYTLTSKQSNKHILIVVKCPQLSTNNIGSANDKLKLWQGNIHITEKTVTVS